MSGVSASLAPRYHKLQRDSQLTLLYNFHLSLLLFQASSFWSFTCMSALKGSTGLMHASQAEIVTIYRYVRVTSARSLAGMTVFSMLVNLTLGSTMSRSITQPDLNLTRGLISIAVIFGFEYVTDWLSARHSGLAKLFEKEPELLAFRGQIDYKAIKRNRLAEGAIWMTMRQKGYLCLSEVSRRVTEVPTYREVGEQSARHSTDCYFFFICLLYCPCIRWKLSYWK